MYFTSLLPLQNLYQNLAFCISHMLPLLPNYCYLSCPFTTILHAFTMPLLCCLPLNAPCTFTKPSLLLLYHYSSLTAPSFYFTLTILTIPSLHCLPHSGPFTFTNPSLSLLENIFDCSFTSPTGPPFIYFPLHCLKVPQYSPQFFFQKFSASTIRNPLPRTQSLHFCPHHLYYYLTAYTTVHHY